MAILKILQDGDPDLRKKSKPVEKINKRILTLLDDMLDTLAEANGYGLAAPQVGVLRRVFIIITEENELIEVINPEIIACEGKQTEVEGCLSSPEKYALIDRPASVTVRYQNRNGEYEERMGEGIMARAFCHETDHLNGILCFDNAVKLLTADEARELAEAKKEKE